MQATRRKPWSKSAEVAVRPPPRLSTMTASISNPCGPRSTDTTGRSRAISGPRSLWSEADARITPAMCSDTAMSM